MSEQTFVFDHMAETYDSDFSDTSIGEAQRKQVWDYLKRKELIIEDLECLELNAGTGVDADWMSGFGARVTATDKSSEMVAQIKVKNSNVMTAVVSFEQIESQFQGQKFDLIFSNFGGLNCIDKHALRDLGKGTRELLQSGGKAVFVVMPKYCIWEMVYFLLKLDFNKAFRRYKKGGEQFGDEMKIHYYNPKELREAFGNGFEVADSQAIGFFVPPSYLQPFFDRFPRVLKVLSKLDKWFARFLPAKLGDHYLIELRKV